MIDGYSNKPIVADNVIVQYCETYYYNGIASRPVVELTGSGVCDVYIGGNHIRGSWSRKAAGDRTIYMDLNEKNPQDSKIGLTMRQPGLGKLQWLEEDRAKLREKRESGGEE